MIVVIPCPADGCKPDEYDAEWLPRQCPTCQQTAVVGHGRRRRQAHDDRHDWIRVRRGICKRCRQTLTALPWWCVPWAHYSLAARRESLARIAADEAIEAAAPQCLDPDRVADPSTICRWALRRIESLPLWLVVARHYFCDFSPPTILAWDFRAAGRILTMEPLPP